MTILERYRKQIANINEVRRLLSQQEKEIDEEWFKDIKECKHEWHTVGTILTICKKCGGSA